METVSKKGFVIMERLATYINCYDTSAKIKFEKEVYRHISSKASDFDKIVVLCIGTDRATGDSLGPLIGYKLINRKGFKKKMAVLGTLEAPVHAQNLSDTIRKIYESYTNPLVIAVDACLGREEYIGYLTIAESAMRPGAGVKKELPSVGDISITGIVNNSGVLDIVVLQNTRLGIVMRIADVIAEGICGGIKLFLKDSYS